MEIKQLKYFLAVSDCGSFSKAAVLLSVAQSALSRHVRSLEEELGAPLPAVLPERALAKPTNPITRYAVGVGLTLALLVIASGPIALLYWLMSGG